MSKIQIEICAPSLTSAIRAQNGGADRIELCAGLELGGLTPSASTILAARKRLKISICVLIRPRAGDFVYNEDEWKIIQDDIVFCRENGCDGVVVGCLKNDGTFDSEKMRKMYELAYPMEIVCHRAFDRTINAEAALRELIELKYHRVLTSGQSATAFEGKEKLKKLVTLADNKIEIMPGSGIDLSNLKNLIGYTQARNFHLSAKQTVNSNFLVQKTNVKFNLGNTVENNYLETDEEMVRHAVAIARDYSSL